MLRHRTPTASTYVMHPTTTTTQAFHMNVVLSLVDTFCPFSHLFGPKGTSLQTSSEKIKSRARKSEKWNENIKKFSSKVKHFNAFCMIYLFIYELYVLELGDIWRSGWMCADDAEEFRYCNVALPGIGRPNASFKRPTSFCLVDYMWQAGLGASQCDSKWLYFHQKIIKCFAVVDCCGDCIADSYKWFEFFFWKN